ncbi:amidophosphoribosyltransferase [bacterium]|nr:amidophosphoribosyltransferase [bacterium]
MCGIFGIQDNDEALHMVFLGLYGLQHRGEESAGIAAFGPNGFCVRKGTGLVEKVLREQKIKELSGHAVIGHVRYSTTGSSNPVNVQPFSVNHKGTFIAVAHNGNLTNTRKLCDYLEESGSIFQTSMDSEVLVHLLVKSPKRKLSNKFKDALSRVQGAYSALFLIDDILVGARDPYGVRPLSLGKIGSSYILSSETCAFDMIGAKFIRDIEPGEIIFIHKDGTIESDYLESEKKAHCVFEQIYFSRPDSRVFGDSIYAQRKNLGKMLAKEFPLEADMVLPVPDSGSYAALGYAEGSGIPFEMGIVRNHYIGRTFISPFQSLRELRVKIKLNPIKDVIKGKKIIVIEDSIVRGTTSKNRIESLRKAGAKEIYMLVSCPPIVWPCFYGIDFPTKDELIASTKSVKKIKDFIGVDFLGYLSLNGMKKALSDNGRFCDACFSGEYPIPVSLKTSKYMMEKQKTKFLE